MDANELFLRLVAKLNVWPILAGKLISSSNAFENTEEWDYPHIPSYPCFVKSSDWELWFSHDEIDIWNPLVDMNQLTIVEEAVRKQYWVKTVIGQYSVLIYMGPYDNGLSVVQSESLGPVAIAKSKAMLGCLIELEIEKSLNL